MDLKQSDADSIFGDKTYFICFRHKHDLSKIPYPYIQKAAEDGEGTSIVTNLQGILDNIEAFQWAVQEGVELDEILEIIKNRLEVIRDNFKASSDSMTADHKEVMETTMTKIKDSLKRKYNQLIQQGNPLDQQQKKQKRMLTEIMDLTTDNMGSE
tara:strand:- start:3058 stop:3522 length:465 start_codon:yes stop_codon:yes gene_type:complete